MHGLTCIFWDNLTPFSLKAVAEHLFANRPALLRGLLADWPA